MVHLVLLRALARFARRSGAKVGSRYKLLQICLGCRSKSKNRDELMNYTVRVMGQALFICLVTRKLSRCRNIIFLIFINPVAEILLRRREGEKFYNSSDSYLQAL